MGNESESIATRSSTGLGDAPWVRRALAACVLAALVGGIGYFLNGLLPHDFSLRISGGEILGNKHYLARMLREEAAHSGVSFQVVPTSGSETSLEMVDEGTLDIAFVQGGTETSYANVRHVATVAPELFHVLVRPDIKTIADLHGRTVNLSSRTSNTRKTGVQIFEFAGLKSGVDYVETNFSIETLISMRADKLPDAITLVSFAPSFIANYMVEKRGYTLLEMPFPAAMSMHHGWVSNSTILAYSYSVTPPVPPKDIATVGVTLHMVANRNVDPRAVYEVLETLLGPGMESHIRIKFDEGMITAPSGFPLHDGTKMYVARNAPLLSPEVLEKVKPACILLVLVILLVVVVVKWSRWEASGSGATEDDYPDLLRQVGEIESDFLELEPTDVGHAQATDQLITRLSAIKAEALKQAPKARAEGRALLQSLLIAVADTRATIENAGRGRPGNQEEGGGLFGMFRGGARKSS